MPLSKPLPPSSKNALILGYGYLGERLGDLLLEEGGWAIAATTRSGETSSRSDIERSDIDCKAMDLAKIDRSEIWSNGTTHAAYMIAPGREGDPELGFYQGALDCLDRLNSPTLQRFIYISSTGVYAQRGGEWLDEGDPAQPVSPRAQWIRKAEEALIERANQQGLPVSILRLGGIYGPGRSPLEWLAQPSMKKRLVGSATASMNWIHVDDAAQAIRLAFSRAHPGEIYNIVDDAPSPRGEIYQYAAGLAGVEPPKLPVDPSDLGKRVSNRKAKEGLGWSPTYRSYREGLAWIAGE